MLISTPSICDIGYVHVRRGTQESRAVDDGTRLVKERYARTLKDAESMIANHPAAYAGPNFTTGDAFRTVYGYEVDGDTVIWHL